MNNNMNTLKELIIKLRDETGFSMLDCRIALLETNNELNAAKALLIKKGCNPWVFYN